MAASPRRLSERLIAFAGRLDLGRKPMDYCGSSIGPAMTQPKVWYPNLWIEGVDQPIDLPDKGRATIEYRVTRKTTTDTGGKKRHEASLEIHSIEPVEAGKNGKGKGRGPEAAGDHARAVKLSALTPGMVRGGEGVITFGRVRNQDGEFAPQADGVPDPATMRAAYGPLGGTAKQPGAAKAAAGAAAGLGGTAAAALLLARKLKGKRV